MRTILTRARSLILIGALALVLAPVALLYGQGYSNANPLAYWVAPGNCGLTASGTATGTTGLTVVGTANMPVMQATASAVGTHSFTYVCNISPPATVVTTALGLQIIDAVFAYGGPTTLGTQSASLASGTMNSAQVFSYVAYPTPAIGETISTVTPVRADSGTLVITPVVASFNTASNTAGAFFTTRFAPAAGTLVWKTDLRQLLLTVTLTALNGLATTVTSPGVLVHYR